MAMLGTGAIAMWWNIAPELRADFEHWHTHEHFPERLAVPGFLRASRWAAEDGGEGFFVLYELDQYDTLTSAAYRARLNAPTPWSTRLMPHHRDMVRSQCRVVSSHGGALSRQVLTVRLSPAPGAEGRLRQALGALARDIAAQPGTAAGHLLQTQTPALAATTEQKMRGGADAAADWVFLACGYDLQALRQLAAGALGDASLQAMGAGAGIVRGIYGLSHSNTAGDVA